MNAVIGERRRRTSKKGAGDEDSMEIIRTGTRLAAQSSARLLTLLAGFVWLILTLAPDGVQATPAADPPAQCKALASADFSQVLDATAQVKEAQMVSATKDDPAYCRIQGYVTPNVGIEVRLPTAGWNGKFLKVGCGGLCGTIIPEHCEFAVRRGYACIVSDMGHTSTGNDGKWAYNNLEGKVDFAYRATHVAALAGKAITERYYRKAPERSYFIGCSQGGRQALVEAQRFPWDFDGIIAGAPVISHTLSSLHLLWATALTQPEVGAKLPAQVVKQVHETVLNRCDLDDGVADGLIGNPRACRFDPSELACSSRKKHGCLTDAHADIIKKLYSGATSTAGEKLYWGAARGSELTWLDSLVSTSEGPTAIHNFAVELFKYLVFVPDPGPLWQSANFDIDKDYRRFGMMESLYNASNPDLRRFKAAGGKLLIFQGWNDALVPPDSVIDYYETVQRTMGGRETTQDFSRLFMLPGADHCAGGVGATAIDYLTSMENWVEHGQAPDRLIGAHLKNQGAYAVHRSFPLNPDDVAFTRPVYPYPAVARYTGTGDPKQADHFAPFIAK